MGVLQNAGLVVGGGALVGAKVTGGKKFLEWRADRKKKRYGVGAGPRRLAELDTKKLESMYGYRKQWTRDIGRELDRRKGPTNRRPTRRRAIRAV